MILISDRVGVGRKASDRILHDDDCNIFNSDSDIALKKLMHVKYDLELYHTVT